MKLLVGPSLQSCWLNISLISHGQSESLFRNPRNRVACMDGVIPDSDGRFVVTIKLAETPPLKSKGGCATQTDLLAVNQSVKASARRQEARSTVPQSTGIAEVKAEKYLVLLI